MTLKYSRGEKEKWIAGTPKPKRRGPVPIPPSNNQVLINNKLALIGRVLNPQIQKPKALMEFMLHHWEIEDKAVGRELGPSLFLIRFQDEEILKVTLDKAPFHYKRWMFILQRWEPIVSDYFPAFIPFWIEVQGIPLHHWSDQTLCTIGAELGFVIDRDVDLGKIRVRINALEPLEMSLPIQLPTGEVTTVNLVYDKLEKHCFSCFSLSHEEKDCPLKEQPPVERIPEIGINQRRTVTRAEEDRIRHSSRRDYRAEQTERRSRNLESRHRETRERYRRPYDRPSHRSPSSRSQRQEINPKRSYNREHPRDQLITTRDSSPKSSLRGFSQGHNPTQQGSRYQSLSDHMSSRYRQTSPQNNDLPQECRTPPHIPSRGRHSPISRRLDAPHSERMGTNGDNYHERRGPSPTDRHQPLSHPTSLVSTPIEQVSAPPSFDPSSQPAQGKRSAKE
ncbi:unnamed protein product [Microthlaspi erraticum]|uniref:DUF4283 domain-containing protein n=1 Tax=Microthlaspi erraticum TaxID=1685480 RepID=A0A6D2HPB0_9BRAS|nr:unnamed protein product [Microthlaspi erraticum]CAA7053087.1 unnamed protein product [Microthlaspi erraticum]